MSGPDLVNVTLVLLALLVVIPVFIVISSLREFVAVGLFFALWVAAIWLWPPSADCRDDCVGELCHIDCSGQNIVCALLLTLAFGGAAGALLRAIAMAFRSSFHKPL